MTSATTKHSSLCLMGITCDEYDTAEKIYTLSVNADNLEESIREIRSALEQIDSMLSPILEDELNGILIGQIKLTISANPKADRLTSYLTAILFIHLPVGLFLPEVGSISPRMALHHLYMQDFHLTSTDTPGDIYPELGHYCQAVSYHQGEPVFRS